MCLEFSVAVLGPQTGGEAKAASDDEAHVSGSSAIGRQLFIIVLRT